MYVCACDEQLGPDVPLPGHVLSPMRLGDKSASITGLLGGLCGGHRGSHAWCAVASVLVACCLCPALVPLDLPLATFRLQCQGFPGAGSCSKRQGEQLGRG